MGLHKPRICLFMWGVLIASGGCRKVHDNGYHVVAYDGSSKEWTVIDKDFDRDQNKYHRNLRFVLACSSSSFNKLEFEKGPDACDLRVGEVFATDLGRDPRHHVFVDPHTKNAGTGELQFYLARDENDRHEVQFFSVVREETVPDEQ